MRLAFVSTLDEALWGGSEELWSRAAVELKRQGHDVMASVAFWRLQSEHLKEVADKGVEVHAHSTGRAGRAKRILNFLLHGRRKGHDRIKTFVPDLVVISQGHNAGGFDWARECRDAQIPYVVVVHCNSERWWFPDPAIDDATQCYVHAQTVFCVSRSNLELLQLQIGARLSNAEVIWSPCSVSEEPVPEWPDILDGYRFACVARLELAAKGQDLLLRTLARPEWRNRPVELNCYGSGPNEEGLKRISKMLGLNNVRIHGHVRDVRSIWRENHLLVLPSRYEGLPLVLIESMLCGRPAVVTDVGGNAELCLDGDTGFIAPFPTLSSFSEALERAWAHREEWPTLGRSARLRAEAMVPKNPVSVFCESIKQCVLQGANLQNSAQSYSHKQSVTRLTQA